MSIFSKMALRKPQTSTFDLSHDHKTTFNMGELIPTTCMEVLPGDKWNIKSESLLRFQPLVAPVMHKVNVTTHYFFVPWRLLWKNWEPFITGNGEHVAPFVNLPPIETGSLGDYMGLPLDYPIQGNPIPVSPAPFAAYLKIYDEYYRDQNLQEEAFVPLEDNYNEAYPPILGGKCKKRAWMHDYFTSALPFAQKGDAVTIPLTNASELEVISKDNYGAPKIEALNGTQTPDGPLEADSGFFTLAGEAPVKYNPDGNLYVDANAEATDINTLRRAFRLQEWLEKNARGGTRYIEQLKAHFFVKSSDARLQRPEYIGGTKGNMVISEVLSTAATETTEQGETALGTMAGHAISANGSKNLTYRAEEHGFIIGIMNVQPITAYASQGIHRSFSRFDKLDFAWPTFAHIGEQEILAKELYASAVSNPDRVFGYIPRYSEYRYMNSRISGDMRNNLDYWTWARFFEDAPQLNADFIECNPSTYQFAVEDTEDNRHIIAHVIHHIKVNRRLPKYGIPTL